MSRRPGMLYKMKDGRRIIMYSDQPLLMTNKKLVLHIVDEELKPVLNEDGNQKTLIVTHNSGHDDKYDGMKFLGYID